MLRLRCQGRVVGIVGGGGNIAIATAYSYLFVYCIVNIKQFMKFLYLFFFRLAWSFGFWTWRLTLACCILFPLSAEYSVVMCVAWPGTLVTWPWSRLDMTYCCAQRLWYQICVTCWSCWFLDLVAMSSCTQNIRELTLVFRLMLSTYDMSNSSQSLVY